MTATEMKQKFCDLYNIKHNIQVKKYKNKFSLMIPTFENGVEVISEEDSSKIFKQWHEFTD